MSDGATPTPQQQYLPAPLRNVGASDLMSLGCTHSGFLRKRQRFERLLKAFNFKSLKWRQKFVILSQGCLYCFGSEYSTQPLQAFALCVYDRVQRFEDATMRYCFEVVPEDLSLTAHVFACESDQKRLEWMEYIHEALRLTHGHSDGRRKTTDYDEVEKPMRNMQKMDDTGSGGSLRKSRSSLPPLPRLPSEGGGGGRDRKSARPPDRSNYNPVPLPDKKSSEYDLESDDEEDEGGLNDTYDDIGDVVENRVGRSPNATTSPTRPSVQSPTSPKSLTSRVGGVALPGMGLSTIKPPIASKPSAKPSPTIAEETEDDEYYNDVTPGEYLLDSSDRTVVQMKLKGLPIGYFLVRNSNRSPGSKVLSVLTEEGVKEYSVIMEENNVVRLNLKDKFPSLHEMIVYYMSNPLPTRNIELKRGYKHMCFD